VDNVKAQIEELLYNNATDLEIAKVLKKDIKTYFSTLEETFANTGGKDFLVKHTKKIDTVLKAALCTLRHRLDDRVQRDTWLQHQRDDRKDTLHTLGYRA
jgi:hypothetical protein